MSDTAFGPTTRERVEHDLAEFPREWPVPTAPCHRYVSVPCEGASGFTVFPRGIFEYELLPSGHVALTVLRGVGQQSRGNLPARPGHAAWPSATPDAQEIGPFRAECAVAFMAVREDDEPPAWAALERLAEEFHAPLAGAMLRQAVAPPPSVAGPVLAGDGLVVRAVKQAESGDAIVLRCLNVTGRAVTGSWTWPRPAGRAARARLDETVTGDIPLSGRGERVEFVASPREVVTILVWP